MLAGFADRPVDVRGLASLRSLLGEIPRLKRRSDGIDAGTMGEGMNRKREIDPVAVAGIPGVRAKSLDGAKGSATGNALTIGLGDRACRCDLHRLEKVRSHRIDSWTMLGDRGERVQAVRLKIGRLSVRESGEPPEVSPIGRAWIATESLRQFAGSRG